MLYKCTDGELLSDITLLTLYICYYHQGTRLNVMNRVLSLQSMLSVRDFETSLLTGWVCRGYTCIFHIYFLEKECLNIVGGGGV